MSANGLVVDYTCSQVPNSDTQSFSGRDRLSKMSPDFRQPVLDSRQ